MASFLFDFQVKYRIINKQAPRVVDRLVLDSGNLAPLDNPDEQPAPLDNRDEQPVSVKGVCSIGFVCH